MGKLCGEARLGTHEVQNQPAAFMQDDLWASDVILRHYARTFGASADHLTYAGQGYGCFDLRHAAAEARRDPPRLQAFDTHGQRVDEVHFNAGYHAVMRTGMVLGYHNVAWTLPEGGQVTHAAHVYMLSQVEPGVCCPLTMTYAAYPALQRDPERFEGWAQKLLGASYSDALVPMSEKPSVTLGMAMTEKQGGSDVRANQTRAARDGADYRLTGHKWFCSAPMSDGFLTLSQADGGLTCFLVPRWLEGGRNTIRLQRLKDKLGNRANASAEIEYEGALAYRLGEEGDGVRQIIEMVHHTRLDTAMAPAGLMRGALNIALNWAQHRAAFQRKLVDQPLMRAVLADLALEAEAALALGMRIAMAFDGTTEADRSLARVGVALAKFLNNKRCPHVIVECLEVMGGMGYIEDSGLPMFYREAPLNGIWEGSGNVICLDILRSLQKDPLAGQILEAEFLAAKGRHPGYDRALAAHQARWPQGPTEAEARWFAESLAQLLASATLLTHAPSQIAESYCESRFAARGTVIGAADLPHQDAILERALPVHVA